MAVFVGPTEITIVGEIRIGANDVQEIYVGSTKVFPVGGGGGLPNAFFVFTPVTGGGLPVTSTFTRTTTGLYFDGTEYQSAAIDEARFQTLPDVPRHFLWEPQRANRLSSIDLTNPAWNKNSVTVSNDGSNVLGLTQYTIDAGSGNNAPHYVTATATPVQAGAAYDILKRGVGTQFAIIRRGASDTEDYACFDLDLGTITETGVGLVDAFIKPRGNGWFVCGVNNSDSASGIMDIALSTTGTPGTARPSFNSAGETLLTCHAQFESGFGDSSPVIGIPRAADNLTDVDWPAESSAIVDVTVSNPILGTDNLQRQIMLGFGASSDAAFMVNNANQAQIKNLSIVATVTAASDYTGERHKYGMSLKQNEGICVDDEDNDATDLVGGIFNGSIFVGGTNAQQGLVCMLHSAEISAETSTVEELKALV